MILVALELAHTAPPGSETAAVDWASRVPAPPAAPRLSRRRCQFGFRAGDLGAARPPSPGSVDQTLPVSYPVAPPASLLLLQPSPGPWMHQKTPSMQPLLSDSSPEGSLDQFDLLEEGKQPRPSRRALALPSVLGRLHARLPAHVPVLQVTTRKLAAAVGVVVLVLLGWSAHGRGVEARRRGEALARRRGLSRAGLGGPQGTVDVLRQRVIPKEELLTKAAPALSLYDALRPELRYLMCDSWSGLSESSELRCPRSRLKS